MSYDNALGLDPRGRADRVPRLRPHRSGEAVMTTAGWIQLLVFLGLIFVFTPLLGGYMAKVWARRQGAGRPRLRPDRARASTASAGSTPRASSAGRRTRSRCSPSARSSLLFVYGFQRLQSHLPFNPDHLPAVRPDLAWNTAVSFITNTNWQSYGGESTMSHLTQMAGLAVQNFVSAAAGLAVMVALIRGLTRRRGRTIGNFWVDLIRTTLRILRADRVRRRHRAREPGRDPELPRVDARHDRRRWRRRRSRAVRPRASSRSSSSAPTAAASSTRTRRTRSRTRTASRT